MFSHSSLFSLSHFISVAFFHTSPTHYFLFLLSNLQDQEFSKTWRLWALSPSSSSSSRCLCLPDRYVFALIVWMALSSVFCCTFYLHSSERRRAFFSFVPFLSQHHSCTCLPQFTLMRNRILNDLLWRMYQKKQCKCRNFLRSVESCCAIKASFINVNARNLKLHFQHCRCSCVSVHPFSISGLSGKIAAIIYLPFENQLTEHSRDSKALWLLFHTARGTSWDHLSANHGRWLNREPTVTQVYFEIY